MIDKALFVGNTGAKDTMHKLQLITNNLSNLNTPGFREDLESKKTFQASENGIQTRAYPQTDKSYSNFDHGPMLTTGRDLDVAIEGKGFFSVISKTGEEGYTRAGDFHIEDGLLKTTAGQVVKGTSGVVSIPGDAERMSIGDDGTVAIKIKGQPQTVTINRLKLTNPDISQLQKGPDGLFYTLDGSPVLQSDKIKLVRGTLEGSNVNPVETLTDLIELSREFEMNTNLMKILQDNATQANGVLELPR
ncbi:MAG: flagellar basal body rod protein FlgF [Gammaproteobacteria bacterium]